MLRFILLAGLLAAQRALAQSESWNFTLSATSPLITYAPYGDGKRAENGWAIWTSEVGFNPDYGTRASGTVLHVSALAGSSFTFDFRGSAVHLVGQSNATYTVSIDGAETPGEVNGELLFSSSPLELGHHTLTLTVTSAQHGQSVRFSQAIVTTSSSSSLSKTTYTRNDPLVSYTGSWSDQTLLDAAYRETNTPRASVTLSVSGAVAVAANANLNYGHWVYEVSVDGQVQPKQYNASSLWLVPSTTLFFVDNLDPAKEHKVTLTHLGDEDYFYFSISSFDVYRVAESTAKVNNDGPSTPDKQPQTENKTTDPPAPQQASVSLVAVIGIVAGGIALLVLLLLAAFCIARSRRRVVPKDGARLGPILDMEKPSPPPSTRFSPPASRSSPPASRISPPGSRITPLPLPPPPRIPFDTDDTISVPPSMPSTDGGIRPYGAAARQLDKRRQAGVVDEPTAGASASRGGAYAASQSVTDAASPTATERRAVERVIAMIAERMDQPPGFITNQQEAPPPSYRNPSLSRKR